MHCRDSAWRVTKKTTSLRSHDSSNHHDSAIRNEGELGVMVMLTIVTSTHKVEGEFTREVVMTVLTIPTVITLYIAMTIYVVLTLH